MSYFTPLPLIIREDETFRCKGIRHICEKCPSFSYERNLPPWQLNKKALSALEKTKSTKFMVCPSSDLYGSDVPKELREEALAPLYEKGRNHFFYILTRNPLPMLEERLPDPAILWGYSAATQPELNFYDTVTQSHGGEDHQEFLFLSPLIEDITLPEGIKSRVREIFIQGAKSPDPDTTPEFPLERVEAIADQVKGTDIKLRLLDSGDKPTYKGKSAKRLPKQIKALLSL